MNDKNIPEVKDLANGWLGNRYVVIWAASILAVLLRVGLSFAFKTYQFDPQRTILILALNGDVSQSGWR